MFLQAVHRTRYEYRYPATNSHNEVRIMPTSGPTQRCMRFSIEVNPTTPIFSYEDVGGMVHHFGILEPHSHLEIFGTALVETIPTNPFDGVNLVDADFDFYSRDATRNGWAEYLAPSAYVELTQDIAEFAPTPNRRESASRYLIGLNTFLFHALTYDGRVTDVHSTVSEVLETRAGVCQDFAHLMVAICRTQGIPTRYVSGYLYGGEGYRGELGTHAWVECLLPNGAWLSLDPTNNLVPNDHYIRVHVGRDYADVSPTRGVYVGAAATKMDFGVTVVEVSGAYSSGSNPG